MKSKKSKVSSNHSVSSTPKEPKIPSLTNYDPKDITFALDIGTRSIVGVLGINTGQHFQVLDYVQKFHQDRAMRDGQIENISLVASIIQDVKQELESRHNLTLHKVCIAAAGRALITKKVSYTQELDPTEEITTKLLHALEYCALGMAQSEFRQDTSNEEQATFYCVGYSVVQYHLDGFPCSTIVGHRGHTVTIDLIAAFLPQIVVQSLYSVTSMNQLDVENITLEPIAAMNVIVPPDIRLLNIALVDIGAGTSDIAISKDGSIIAYDMVTIAGDEITEAIMRSCLVHFDTAEEIKLQLGSGTSAIKYVDILGNPHKSTKEEILAMIQPAIEQLSAAIVERILSINEQPPMAIFLAGGGCQIPGLCESISAQMNLPLSNIAIAGKQPLKHITFSSKALRSPEFVTPIGIGAFSSVYQGCNFFSIRVNGKNLMLLHSKEPKVLDALLLTSIRPQNLIGLSSRSITYYLNGQRFVVKGKNSVPGELYVNGIPASIDTKIKQGDEIIIKEAIDGETPVIRIKDIQNQPELSLQITVDDLLISVPPIFTIEGQTVEPDYIIQSMDRIESKKAIRLVELFDYLNQYPEPSAILTINGMRASLDSLIKTGDVLKITHQPQILPQRMEHVPAEPSPTTIEAPTLPKAEVSPTVATDLEHKEVLTETIDQNPVPSFGEMAPSASTQEETQDTFFENPLVSEKSQAPQQIDDTPDVLSKSPSPMAGGIHVCINNVWHRVAPSSGNRVYFFDLLNYVDIDLQKPQGNIILLLNGQDASYTAWISDGDKAEIKWDSPK
ncbi:MAG: cell division protein FtsA [Epulopiscium sp.]|nr:cell division protein FtsA [Candidatus Epulonipiscium sp.]